MFLSVRSFNTICDKIFDSLCGNITEETPFTTTIDPEEWSHIMIIVLDATNNNADVVSKGFKLRLQGTNSGTKWTYS